MVRIFCRYVADETGATAIEYALIASLIAVFLIGALAALGTRVSGEFSEVSGALQ
jgi:pilus assembly protein Flp/PilA